MAEELRHRQREALQRGSTTLLRSDAVFTLHPRVLNYLWEKVIDLATEVNNGVADDEEGATICFILPPLVRDKNAEYVRKHDGVKSRRGAYVKGPYSHSGNYSQTTLSKKEFNQLGLGAASFPDCRTFQVTHLALLYADQRPPEDGRLLYNASHLCGRSDCIRPSHLMWERLDINFSRRLCHVYGADPACPHEPQCILRAPFRHYLELLTERPPTAAAAAVGEMENREECEVGEMVKFEGGDDDD